MKKANKEKKYIFKRSRGMHLIETEKYAKMCTLRRILQEQEDDH